MTSITISWISAGAIADLLRMSPVVKFVLLLLFFFSVTSWAIILYKWRVFLKVSRNTKLFSRVFRDSSRWDQIYKAAQVYNQSPAAEAFRVGYLELAKMGRLKSNPSSQPDGPPPPNDLGGLDAVSRVVRGAEATQLSRLERRLGFLATTGSTCPFIGLFGTVWGIMATFRGIGVSGQATLAVVAPGISEALVATAAGLAAAIPAVVAYNHYINKVNRISVELDGFLREFLNLVERNFFTPKQG